MTAAQLGAYSQDQGMTNSCGPYAVATAINMLIDAALPGRALSDLADWGWPRTRVWPGSATPPESQANLANWVNSDLAAKGVAKPRFSAQASRGTTTDLITVLQDPDSLAVVTLNWDGNKKSGHAMVLAAYDETQAAGPWGFVNSWGGADLYSVDHESNSIRRR
jgi:hypothetical protein